MRSGDGLPNDELNAASLYPAACRFTTAFNGFLLALALLLSGPVFATGLICTASPESPAAEGQRRLDELEEVVITGEKVTGKDADVQAWIARLVGQFTYEGDIALCDKDNAAHLLPVTGTSKCVAIGILPTVNCELRVRWAAPPAEQAPAPGSLPNLDSAMLVYSMQAQYQAHNQTYLWSVLSIQVDNKGITERAAGYLMGDTLKSREPCVGMPGRCWKITRTTARPGNQDISVVIDFELDSRRVLRQSFLLHRGPDPQKSRHKKGSSP